MFDGVNVGGTKWGHVVEVVFEEFVICAVLLPILLMVKLAIAVLAVELAVEFVAACATLIPIWKIMNAAMTIAIVRNILLP